MAHTESDPRQRIIREIAAVSSLKGEFKLRSGTAATLYFDKYQFEARPDLLAPLADWMAGLLDEDVDVLAGLELGGIPLATAMALATGLPAVFVRKEAKDYGTCKAIEGPDVAGKKVTVIEDVVTTGGQIVKSVGALRAAGAIVNTVVCAIWRGSDLSLLSEAGLTLRSVLTADDLKST
jgi:orotate phosphoribosyltransferase